MSLPGATKIPPSEKYRNSTLGNIIAEYTHINNEMKFTEVDKEP